MSENNTNNSEGILDQLSLATKIVSPTQLFALTILVLLALYVLRRDVTIPAFFIVIVLGLYQIGQSRNKQEDEIEVPVLELPKNLKLPDDLFNSIKDPLTNLDLNVTHGVRGELWGEDCYYTEAKNEDKNIGLVSLDSDFFKYGDRWKTGRWFNVMTNLPDQKFSELIVFSDTNMICQEALYEIEDVKKREDTKIILMTKIYVEQFLKASTPEEMITESFKLHLNIP
jgi:hypothetical protein